MRVTRFAVGQCRQIAQDASLSGVGRPSRGHACGGSGWVRRPRARRRIASGHPPLSETPAPRARIAVDRHERLTGGRGATKRAAFPTRRKSDVAKPELGTKRQCRSCANRFYDLSRDPIICPKCGAVFQLHDAKPVAPVAAEAVPDDEAKLETTAGPELVPLEEADAGAPEKLLDAEEEVEAVEADAGDETFLEEEEEGDDDVSTLIDGDIEDDEET